MGSAGFGPQHVRHVTVFVCECASQFMQVLDIVASINLVAKDIEEAAHFFTHSIQSNPFLLQYGE